MATVKGATFGGIVGQIVELDAHDFCAQLSVSVRTIGTGICCPSALLPPASIMK
ncbi:hypothetical protein [Salinibacterium sp. UTAS2018]|uniref:hypothetical protein n=1 Tax=Salinibacterium sp. UTAS2018 TaxID=2508880 RepID=UPI001FF00DF6|nr:hypothetical protein [Salinibacterium sp. UTAS2018]